MQEEGKNGWFVFWTTRRTTSSVEGGGKKSNCSWEILFRSPFFWLPPRLCGFWLTLGAAGTLVMSGKTGRRHTDKLFGCAARNFCLLQFAGTMQRSCGTSIQDTATGPWGTDPSSPIQEDGLSPSFRMRGKYKGNGGSLKNPKWDEL